MVPVWVLIRTQFQWNKKKHIRNGYFISYKHIVIGDVLRHITQTNVRAAETVKLEMDKERMTTFQQIKEFYRQNVKQILDTEIVG